MPLATPSPQIILRIVRKDDGKMMQMNIPENKNYRVKYVKLHLQQSFHSHGKFHLFYKGRHIKSRHKLSYYGITADQPNIELILA